MTTPEHTPDGHHVVIDGRRWRATDPTIPAALATELRNALMAARRAVGAATRAGRDPAVERGAVHDAKVALGERGHPWWEPPTDASLRVRIAATMRTMAGARSPATTCPSDIARIVAGASWRAAMPLVREVAVELTNAGEVEVTQRGEVVPSPWRGPVRIRRR